MDKNYFLYTLAFLALSAMIFAYFFVSWTQQIHASQEGHQAAMSSFVDQIRLDSYVCSIPTTVSDDLVMQIINDTLYGLEPTYVPNDLALLPANFSHPSSPNVYMRSGVIPQVELLVNAGRVAGHNFHINSSYRGFERQTTIYNNPFNRTNEGIYLAALPGHSEHQLGTAIDISTYRTSDVATEAGYRWLEQNAPNFGFTLSYPKDQELVTGFQHEPWHWRFVGTEQSEKLFAEKEIFNQQGSAFFVDPLSSGTLSRHAFLADSLYVGLYTDKEEKRLLEKDFLDKYLSENDIHEIFKTVESGETSFVEVAKMNTTLSVFKNKVDHNGLSIDRMQMKGGLDSGDQLFIDVVEVPRLDAHLVFAYVSRIDQTDILEEFIFENCR